MFNPNTSQHDMILCFQKIKNKLIGWQIDKLHSYQLDPIKTDWILAPNLDWKMDPGLIFLWHDNQKKYFGLQKHVIYIF